MSGDVSDRKRLISVNGANLRNAHVYISGHHDFFPDECYGVSGKENGLGTQMILIVDELHEPVKTDIAKDGTNGRRSNFFRNRRWVFRFFNCSNREEGDGRLWRGVARRYWPIFEETDPWKAGARR